MTFSTVFLGMLLVAPLYTHGYSECDPSQQCINNRICSFGDLETYTQVATTLFDYTSCQNCINVCIPECNCSSTGKVEQLIKALRLTNNNSGWCTGNTICKNPLIQHALNYPTENLPCERSFKNAQNYIVTLCGSVNMECCNGNCDDFMIDVPPPKCDQHRGHSKEVRWLFSVYIIVTLILWQWSTDQDVGAVLRSERESVMAANTEASLNDINKLDTSKLGSFL